MTTAWLDEAPDVAMTPEGLVQFPPHQGLPAVVMPPRVALAIARSMMICVAAIRDRQDSTPAPTPIRHG